MTDEAEENPVPKLSPRDAFESVLHQTRVLVDTGALHWRITGNVVIAPRVDESAALEVLGDSRPLFNHILSKEIVPGLNREARSPAGIFMHFEGQEKDPAVIQERQARDVRIKETLFTDALSHRILIRRTSKGSVLDGLRWDISVKKHDLGAGTIPDIPYATIELRFADFVKDPASGNFLDVFGVNNARATSFDCHLHDLEAVLKDLTDLKDNLEKMSRRGE